MSNSPRLKRIHSGVAGLCLLSASAASGQELRFPAAAIGKDTAVGMSALAEQLIAAYQDDNRDRYLDNLFRLQMVANRYSDAGKSLAALRALRGNGVSLSATAADGLYAIVATARQRADIAHFDEEFRQAFREGIARLDDRTSALLIRAPGVSQFPLERAVTRALRQQQGKETISIPDALRLMKAYQVAQTFRSIAPLSGALVAEDDRRRYIIDSDVKVRMSDGAIVCTLVMRQRSATRRIPTLLDFTIYADTVYNLADARRAASNGYAGVIGLTRGKKCSPDKPVPYEYDGADAAALIDWIAKQPWSDGRVGMYSGSYEGFTQWAAAKYMPKALKALMTGAPAAPGIDVPMDGNLFLSFVYPWTFYTTNLKGLDDTTYYNFERWNRLNHDWYVSGRAYRELDKIDGTPNPFFDKWIAHPSYDSYWQSMIPYQRDFARINIPVLQTAGYYYGGPGAALYYLTEHYKYNPRPEHYLVIGPYDHILGQRGLVTALGDTTYELAGYNVDPVALTDFGELRYQWFDYIFKGAPKPALLKDKVNYEVMGANVWKHAPSIAAMSDRKLRFYLSATRSGDSYQLTQGKPAADAPVAQTVNLADRSDVDRISPGGAVVDNAIDTWNGVAFVSDPLTRTTELSGLFSGRLDLTTNKKDFDFQISLYELTSNREYVLLSTYWTRASAVGDLVHRRLLTPGKRERLDFKSVRLTSRQLQPGSRIVVLINIIKRPDMQINYGTGKDVSDETIADAGDPLRIEWFGDSFIDLPVRGSVP
jgi:uncharacterized protein